MLYVIQYACEAESEEEAMEWVHNHYDEPENIATEGDD